MTGCHGARKLVSSLPIEMSVARCTVGFMETEQNENNKLPTPDSVAGQPETFDDTEVTTLGAAIIAEHLHAFEVLAK